MVVVGGKASGSSDDHVDLDGFGSVWALYNDV